MQPRDDAFIQQVIQIAKKNFVSGKETNETFKKTAKSKKIDVWENHVYTHPVDKKFLSYDAASIPDSHFIAAAGPTQETLPEFINNTAFRTSPPEIGHIVALGRQMRSKDPDPIKNPSFFQDFTDYFLEPNQDLGGYYITKPNVQGKYVLSNDGQRFIAAGTVVQSALKISKTGSALEKTLDVTCFGMMDGFPILLQEDEGDFCTKAILRIHEISLENYILVHCAAGVGRTGFFIFMLLILRDYEKIFASDDPAKCAEKILNILERMREPRPALLWMNEFGQFDWAIRNAGILYEYKLKMELQKNGSPSTKTFSKTNPTLFKKHTSTATASSPLIEGRRDSKSKKCCTII